MTDRRAAVGLAGERLAADFLGRHGLEVVGRNVAVGRGEVDLLARDGSEAVVVEVRTVTGGEPLEAFGPGKAHQVRRLAGRLGATRVDLVAVRLGPDAAELRWLPGVC